MKLICNSLLMASLLFPSAAFCQEDTATMFDPVTFVNTYMHCAEIHDILLKKEGERSCEEKVNLHFCKLFKPLPADAQQSIGLELSCNLMAELEQQDVAEKIKKAGCLEGADQRKELLKKYPATSDEADALKNFTQAYLKNEDICRKE